MAATQALPATGPAAANDPEAARIAWPHLALLVLQLALLLLLIRQFQIEGKAFVELSALVFGGFVVHALLPLRWRLPFFAALGLLSLALVLGPLNAAWIAALGLLLLAICHAPLPVKARGGLLVLALLILAAQRAGWLPVPWSEAIWPVLGAIFMYRLIIYWYDLRHDRTPVSAAQSAGYFAMLPNACFPLFPVVDFKTWRRSHYAMPAADCYQRGVDWILRGVIQLILYRAVYQHIQLSPSEVQGPAELGQYLVANFMVYLRVSGIYHVVTGMLHLFGFGVPRANKNYLLATSISDHWRRINIYWKDFMQKCFYFPAVMALKRFGPEGSVILATLWVFVVTWLLHGYQWFWLRGSWLLTVQDMLFWTILGLLVVGNSLLEMRRGRKRSLGAKRETLADRLTKIAKAFGTFWLIAFLWSLWTIDSLANWLTLWPALLGSWSPKALLYPGLILLLIVAGFWWEAREKPGVSPRAWMASLALLVGLVALSVETVHTRLGHQIADLVHGLRSPQLSRLDAAKLEKGYYDNLMDVGQFNSQLWEVYAKRPSNWLAADFSGIKRFSDGFEQYRLREAVTSSSQYGPLSLNRHGQRDQDYADSRAPGTLRIALLGASSVMGWGVPDAGSFEALLESRLASEPLPTGFARVELLNQGVPGYQPPQQLANLERAIALQANAIFYVATGREQDRAANYLAELLRKRITIPFPGLQDLVSQSGATPTMSEAEQLKRLEPLGPRILAEVYRLIAERCRANGIAPVWVFLPQLREGSWQKQTAEAQQLAEQAGMAVINLETVFKGQRFEAIRLEEWDEHPNAHAHRLIAERLYTELQSRGEPLFAAAKRP